MKTVSAQNPSSIPVGVARNDRHYNMDHPRRGKALVFNHEVFHEDTELSRRDGTSHDRERLIHALGNLGFEVIIFNDKTYQQIMEAIDKGKDCYVWHIVAIKTTLAHIVICK